MGDQQQFEKIISHAKEYGFVFPSSDIYGGLAAVYDYGQNGVELRNNLRRFWYLSMTRLHQNIVGLDSAIFMHPKVWKASGHVDGFNDPMIDNKDSKKRYRADVLIEEHQEKLRQKIQKEVVKAAKRFGDSFDEQQYRDTNPRAKGYQDRIDHMDQVLKDGLETGELHKIKELIEAEEIACPISGSKNWTEVRQFNLMYSTQMNATDGQDANLYLRPETAQGIFVNYLNVQKTGRMKLPFGIAQTGKAFRNEIVARQFIMRMKEFEQMEIEFFCKEEDENKWFDYWVKKRMEWYKSIGIPDTSLRLREHSDNELAHYASKTVDIEFLYPWGWGELEGIANRGTFDLSSHEKASGKDMSYFDPETNEKITPTVIEPAGGLTRTLFALLCSCYDEEEVNDTTRTLFRFGFNIAPIQIGILPLSKKDELIEVSNNIKNILQENYRTEIDVTQSIGKRYRRQDEIGTPYCITVDFDSLDDNSVTIRSRDSMEQERILITDLPGFFSDL